MHYIAWRMRGQAGCSRQLGGNAMLAAWKTRPTYPDTGVRVLVEATQNHREVRRPATRESFTEIGGLEWTGGCFLVLIW